MPIFERNVLTRRKDKAGNQYLDYPVTKAENVIGLPDGSDFAPKNHTHPQYAETSHTHSQYAPVSHTHSQYAETTHTHSQYAPTSHAHTKSDVGLGNVDNVQQASKTEFDTHAADTDKHITAAQIKKLCAPSAFDLIVSGSYMGGLI